LKFRATKLDVRMWMFLGTISGLTFGVLEERLINYPRRRWQLILLGISMVAVLHGLNDWSVSSFNSYWPAILIQAVSLLLFLGYTMSASSIERQVRRTPLFRGDSMVMDILSEPKDAGRS
jgi:hypothetical protein